MAGKDDADIFVATETGAMAMGDGSEFRFVRGLTRVRAGHEAHRRAPAFFEPVDPTVTYGPDGRRYATQ